VVYFGTPVASLDYLRNIDLACPEGYNAADHWMDLLVVDTAAPEEAKDDHDEEGEMTKLGINSLGRSKLSFLTQDGEQPHSKLQKVWDREVVAEEMDLALVEARCAM
jgi:hypothetical protein